MKEFHSFLWLSDIPLCVDVDVDVCIYIFFCSSVYGHLGCFHILAMVNNAAMNIGVPCIFSNFCFLFALCFFGVFVYIPRSRIAG